MSTARPGWYPDSTSPGHERWWDGTQWTAATRPAAPQPAPQPAPWPQQSYGQPQYGQPQYGQPQYGQPAPGGRATATPDGAPLASPWARLLARLVDGLLVTAVTVTVAFGQVRVLADALADFFDEVRVAAEAGRTVDALQLYDDPRFVEAVAALTVLQILVSAVYTIVLVRLRGATLGKLLCGLRVRPWQSDTLPSWGQSATRWVGREGVSNVPYLGSAYSLLDAVWLLWDQRRQCLHDKLPGTVVVRRKR